MLNYLIELAENEIPVNLGSLVNTFQIDNESLKYKEYVAFRGDIYGAWIVFKIEKVQYYIFFILNESHNIEDDNSKLHDFYDKEDDVIIVRIEKTVDREKIFNNTKYCIN